MKHQDMMNLPVVFSEPVLEMWGSILQNLPRAH